MQTEYCGGCDPIEITPIEPCDLGCPHGIITTDCIVHKTDITIPTCLNFPKETSLSNIIKAFDEAFCNIVFQDSMVKVSSTDEESGYLEDKIKINSNGTLVKTNVGGVEYLELVIKPFDLTLIDWGVCEYCENTMKYCPDGYIYNPITDKCRGIECDCDSDSIIPEEIPYAADTIEEAVNKLLSIICCLKQEIADLPPVDPDLSEINWELCNPCFVEDDLGNPQDPFESPTTLTEAFDLVLQRICCLNEAIATSNLAVKVFYVDGNNTKPGDGSILNPFKTIDLAIDKIIGSGTRVSPEYTNIKVEVATFEYTVTTNLFVNGVTINFSTGSIINHNGTGYLVESTDPDIIYQRFNITGGLSYKRNNFNSGFVNIENPKYVKVHFDSCEDYADGASIGKPLFKVNSLGKIGIYVGTLIVSFDTIIRSYADTIVESVGQTTCLVQGRSKYTSNIVLGASVTSGINNTTTLNNIIKYVNTNVAILNTDVSLTNVRILVSEAVKTVFYIKGSLTFGVSNFSNIDVYPYGTTPTFPDLFSVDFTDNFESFILENIVVQDTFSTSTPGYFINSPVLRRVAMYNNRMPIGIKPNFTTINMDLKASGALRASMNIVNGKIMFTGVESFVSTPTTGQGYFTNMVYATKDGTLKVIQ